MWSKLLCNLSFHTVTSLYTLSHELVCELFMSESDVAVCILHVCVCSVI